MQISSSQITETVYISSCPSFPKIWTKPWQKQWQPIKIVCLFAVPLYNQLTNYEFIIIERQSFSKIETKLFDNKIMFFSNGFDRNEIVGVTAIQQDKQGLIIDKIAHKVNSSVLNSYIAELYGICLVLQGIC